MPLVVSDTSPIRALHHLEQLGLLGRLFDGVVVPPAVQAELSAGRTKRPAIDLADWPTIRVVAPRRPLLVPPAMADLDPGETEAPALALEIGASDVLIDEHDGRVAAIAVGLRPTGVVGVLILAKKASYVPAVRPLVDRLRAELNFFISPRFYADALRLAGE